MIAKDRQVSFAARAGVAIIRVLASTWRMTTINAEPLEAARKSGQRVIFALWHGELLPLLWHQRGENVAIVISDHRDGEIIARIAEALGYATIRGSTSKGGRRALVGLIREIVDGRDGAITPDGPRGPARVFAAGAAVAAYRTGALICPIRARASRCWRLRSWDRFVIPMPFARVTVCLGPLTAVDAATPREAAADAPRLQAILDAVPGS